MSHLLKALQSLESRGAKFAPPAEPAVQPAGEAGVAVMAGDAPAAVAPERPARIKPRPAPRAKPRRATPPVDLFAGRPVVERLAETPPVTPAKPADQPPIPQTAAEAAKAKQYSLAPAAVINQAALEAGAALARELAVQEMASGQCSAEDYPAEPAAAPKTSKVLPASLPSAPVRTATLFEHRVRETLLHPARSRPYAELVQRLKQDFRGSEARSLLFTGIGPASRGDEMLAHVAAMFAEQGERVLVVDADFERAGLTASFGGGTLPGLQNALVAPQYWPENVIRTSFENLSFLPTGRGNLTIATAADALTSLIPRLEAEYPLVLIDGGQSTGSLLAPLARSCDATYFVIRLGATDAKEAQGALKAFRAAGARVMGCVAVMASGE